jgi:DNA repair photolyase
MNEGQIPKSALEPKPSPTRRGAGSQPPNRFAATYRAALPELDEGEPEPLPRTQFIPDHSVSVITYNDSPDLGFAASLNPYRGCEHGCIYCYARPTHEYLGFSAGLDFESRILVKEHAPELLRRELAAPGWRPQVLALSGVTDPYQPVERKLRLTRRCLEVLAECRNPVQIVTKNHLVTRDADLLAGLARHRAAAVAISLTTLDPALRAVLEPRTSPPAARLAAMRRLADAGVPVSVLVAPVIPGLNDAEIPHLLAAAARAGARSAAMQMLRLPLAVAPLFVEWLEHHFPERKDRVLARIRDIRGGRLNDPRFGTRHTGEGPYATQVRRLFDVARRRAGLTGDWPELSTAAFRRPAGAQLELQL